MPRISETTKRERKDRVWLAVKRHQDGILQSELTQITGIESRTLNNYLNELWDEGKVYREKRLWYPLNFKGIRLRPFELEPEEAYTLYLASRLLVKQQDKRNEPAQAALAKLAHVLTSDAGIGKEIEQAAQELALRRDDADYQSVFKTIVHCYIYRKKVRIQYKPLNRAPFETTFATYMLEPSAIGYATYVIGHSSAPDKLRAYKLERIQWAEPTRDGYHVPADFPGLEILRNSWSIILGENTTRVTLRFNPRVRERVLETQWHPSQESCDDPEKPGWLKWWVDVAGTTDMLPWIRGWGADVEVLEPVGLRKALKREAWKLAKLYAIALSKITDNQYYAHSKPNIDESEWQLLKDHLLQTGDLAFELGRDAGVSELARVAGILHDIGKYSQAFQNRLRGSNKRVDHATAGAREIIELFPAQPRRTYAELLSYCIAGHHSGLPDYGSPGDVETDGTLLARRKKKQLEDYSAYRHGT